MPPLPRMTPVRTRKMCFFNADETYAVWIARMSSMVCLEVNLSLESNLVEGELGAEDIKPNP